MPLDNLLKTPQFWLIWSTATLLATGGMGLMSVAKPMIQNVFTDAMPALVTTGFASAYLMAMAGGNLGGRIAWAAVSDKIGRWNTFQMFTLVAIPIYAGLPFLINQCISDPSGSLAPLYLGGFCASTVLVRSGIIEIDQNKDNDIRRSPSWAECSQCFPPTKPTSTEPSTLEPSMEGWFNNTNPLFLLR